MNPKTRSEDLRYAPIITRSVLGTAFLWAALGKLLRPPGSDTIYHGLVGNGYFLHYLFCVSEVGLGLWLVSGWKVRSSAAVSILVLSIFLGAVNLELSRDHPKPCGCGFTAPKVDPAVIRRSLVLNLFMNTVLLSAGAWLFMMKSPGNDSRIRDGAVGIIP
jgi:uncharacterized membrane protein YphA (DoxX/SURF4 family)